MADERNDQDIFIYSERFGAKNDSLSLSNLSWTNIKGLHHYEIFLGTFLAEM